MNKFNKLVKAFSMLLVKPYLLNNVINDTSRWRKHVEKNYGKGSGLPMVDIISLLGSINEQISPFSFLDGGSMPTDLALLRGLARMQEDCSYFEIGTWRGESVANVASIAKECYTLNLSNIEIREQGYPESYVRQYGLLSRKFDNIIHLRGNSTSFDFAGLNKKFDLIFIDGDHHYEMVKNDSHKVFTFLAHEDSVVVWHDYARNPETVRFEVLAGILDGTPKKYHDGLYFISNTLCAIYTRRKLDSTPFQPPLTPGKIFRLHLSSDELKPD